MAFGLPYKGSKNIYAKQICEALPFGKRLVDLFAGGCAITDCAIKKYANKWGPLYPDNREEVMHIVETVKGEFGDEKTIWLYTGYTYGELKKQIDDGDETLRRILYCVDVLVDGPFILSRKRQGLHWVGSDNQCLLRLKYGEVVSEVGKY